MNELVVLEVTGEVATSVISKTQPTNVTLLGTTDTPLAVNPPKSPDAFPLAWPRGTDG